MLFFDGIIHYYLLIKALVGTDNPADLASGTMCT